MDKKILNKEEIYRILSCAEYWNEVNNRDGGGSTDIGSVLRMELADVVRSLGLKVLWILEEYAKEAELNLKQHE